MITAVQELLVSGADLKLVIAGAPVTEEDIAYVKTLKETIASGPQPEAIDLCGPVLHEDIPKLLKNADLFLNLSETGSLDKAVLEAMASGVPVLTSNEGLRSTLAKTVPECFMNDASELPTRIQKFLDMPSEDRVLLGKRLRDMVLSEHSRSDLIRRIIIGLHS
jgi:glycosyltransferase involved in cell wall biosynthesis